MISLFRIMPFHEFEYSLDIIMESFFLLQESGVLGKFGDFLKVSLKDCFIGAGYAVDFIEINRTACSKVKVLWLTEKGKGR